MKTLSSLCWLVSFSVLLCCLPALAGEDADAHLKQGQKLFQEKNFAGALEEFQQADKLMPDQPPLYSWMAACLNAQKRYPEAKEKAEKALSLLRSQPGMLLSNAGALDIGYYSLLAEIQAHLHDFDAAIGTLNEYPLPEGWRENRKQEMEKLDAAKASLQGKMLLVGFECLGSRDAACARKALEKANTLRPVTPEVLLSMAKESLAQADKAPAATDEDKNRKTELYRLASDLIGQLPEAERAKPEAQRVAARVLSGMKGPGDYQKAITILKSLWERSASQEKPDTSILLDLAAAYSNGEDWEGVIKTASEYIQRSPNSPGGPGYCWRSFGNYRLGQCQKTLEDGPKCTNPDGTPRQLKYVDYCRQELEKQKAAAERVAVASKEEIKTKCQQLKTNADWARTNPDAEMTDLVTVIGDFEAGKIEVQGVPRRPGNGGPLPGNRPDRKQPPQPVPQDRRRNERPLQRHPQVREPLQQAPERVAEGGRGEGPEDPGRQDQSAPVTARAGERVRRGGGPFKDLAGGRRVVLQCAGPYPRRQVPGLRDPGPGITGGCARRYICYCLGPLFPAAPQ